MNTFLTVIKYAIFHILHFLSQITTFGIVYFILNLFPAEDKQGNDTWNYIVWDKIFFKFTCLVDIDLHRAFFGQPYSKVATQNG